MGYRFESVLLSLLLLTAVCSLMGPVLALRVPACFVDRPFCRCVSWHVVATGIMIMLDSMSLVGYA